MEVTRFCTECHQASPEFNMLLICSPKEFWSVKFLLKYFNTSTHSKKLLPIFILWISSTFRFHDTTMYLVLLLLISSPIFLLPTTKASAFSFIVWSFLPIQLHRRYKTNADVYHLISSHRGLSETLLMAYSKANFKYNGDRVSCCKIFVTGYM